MAVKCVVVFKFDFIAWTAAKLQGDVSLIDERIERFATWATKGFAAECALCTKYLGTNRTCARCPIARDGHANCVGTPFNRAADREDAEMNIAGGDRPAWLTADDCVAEIRYLLRLRGKLSKALAAKVAARAKKVAKAKAARKKAAARK